MEILLCSMMLLISAFLLSWIQPLAAKILLPSYGGVPMVWSTCMVFFQLSILLGYLYAHVLNTRLSIRQQMGAHSILAGVAVLFLPILWYEVPDPVTTLTPSLSLLLSLIVKIGLPVFFCATLSPLIQSWIAGSNNKAASDPYFLYSASNIGSISALIAFPFILEPWIGIQQQSWLWSYWFVILLVMLILITFILPIKKAALKQEKIAVSLAQKGRWVILAMVPSSLFLAVTQQITIDLPAIPFLWIVPLLIYFLTFVITFAKAPIISYEFSKRNFPLFLVFPTLLLCNLSAVPHLSELIAFPLIGLFAVCMMCHGEIVATRPHTSSLTDFYCWLALGGLLGGIFNTFIAPAVFNGVYEYPLMLIASVLLWPSEKSWRNWGWVDSVIFIILACSLFALSRSDYLFSIKHQPGLDHAFLFIVLFLVFLRSENRYYLAATLACVFFFGHLVESNKYNQVISQERNFYGVKRVVFGTLDNSHSLLNGSTLHGIEYLNLPIKQNSISSYYQSSNDVAHELQIRYPQLQVGIIGLGAGTMVCQFEANTKRIFEIDPMVVKIASNPTYFTYLRDCPGNQLFIGDGRLELKKQAAQQFDALFFDAFSSDSIPIHLLTKEAMMMYRTKLKTHGSMVFHISQRYVDLLPVMRAMSDLLHMPGLIKFSQAQNPLGFASHWVIISNDALLLAELEKNHQWQPLDSTGRTLLWTDDYANLFSAIDV